MKRSCTLSCSRNCSLSLQNKIEKQLNYIIIVVCGRLKGRICTICHPRRQIDVARDTSVYQSDSSTGLCRYRLEKEKTSRTLISDSKNRGHFTRRSPAWIKSLEEDRLCEGAKGREEVRGIREIPRRSR